MVKKRLGIVYGTRPEFIKLWPIIRQLQDDPDFSTVTICTGQHREMLDVIHNTFGFTPDYHLSVFQKNQHLTDLSAKLFSSLGSTLRKLDLDAVVVQGDTATTVIGAQAAFYTGLPVIHVEAGLRTDKLRNPFPEEANRRLVTQLADLHLAPTQLARTRLLAEKVPESRVAVTGNTVIDALSMLENTPVHFEDPRAEEVVESASPFLLVTCHRRENWAQLPQVAQALDHIAAEFPEWRILLPVHGNEDLRRSFEALIDRHKTVVLTGFLGYPEFLAAQKAARIVLSDSGGVQEESPAFGTPVLCMRKFTERQEAVDAGCVTLVGTDTDAIVEAFTRLATDPGAYASMAHAAHPYGTGDAAVRSIEAIRTMFDKRTA
ncbi:non-hydrolyzing UDP-N-acetylglucosamine 2-epimerase [Corynebacterium mendelii]|uniref:UDP-N-acetylglucosamine 2-epimerase (non-hydrolyzing) n=1 Tax=Corynebacterium mendelii TaxID=2765362 RepID=A0A939E2L7_9CORY|nr:UDP-N-acetylglucosamine 2-epimerase (non-hydrolyzing) [Corynebacterium mendelii]MBN9645299.1 UDP-N-acetylglucosamine 2-epimerase (non-hydrolyzing) [Corynebacterium mendelii]